MRWVDGEKVVHLNTGYSLVILVLQGSGQTQSPLSPGLVLWILGQTMGKDFPDAFPVALRLSPHGTPGKWLVWPHCMDGKSEIQRALPPCPW